MTLGRAKSVLSYMWIAGFVVLCTIIGLQTAFGKYGGGEDWDTGFGWFFPLTIPALSLMLTVWTLQRTKEDGAEVTSSHTLAAAVIFSVFYLLAMLGILLLHPFTGLSIVTQLHRSAWPLGVLEGIVMALLGRLFIANAS